MKCTAIVLAAGQGKRMKSSVQKQFLQLGDYPVLYYSMKAFQDAPQITDIILVTGEQEIAYCQEAFVERYQIDKVSAVVAEIQLGLSGALCLSGDGLCPDP